MWRKHRFALLIVAIVLCGWLVIRDQSGISGILSPAGTDSVEIEGRRSSLEVEPESAQPTAPLSESGNWEYLHLFRSLADEAIDLAWSLPTEATIDNTLRSVGRYISDVQVHCRTTECGAVMFYQPAFFALDEESRQAELMQVMTELELLDSVLQVSPRLDAYVGAGLAVLSHELPDGSDPASSIGTIIHFESKRNELQSLQ